MLCLGISLWHFSRSISNMPPTASIFKRYLWSVPVVIIAIIMALLYRDKVCTWYPTEQSITRAIHQCYHLQTDEKHGQRQIWLLIIGTLLGATLSYFDYCFSCAFKSLLLFGEGRKFRCVSVDGCIAYNFVLVSVVVVTSSRTERCCSCFSSQLWL